MPVSESLAREIVASCAAGCTATCLGHPLDCVKVQLQARQQPGLGTARCAAEMLRADGVRAFARGIGPPLANSILMNTFMFVAFARARDTLPRTPAGSLLAGGFAGLVTAALSTPSDFVKIQQQTRGVGSAAILSEALRVGPSALFTGHLMNCGREGVYTAFCAPTHGPLELPIPDDTTHPVSTARPPAAVRAQRLTDRNLCTDLGLYEAIKLAIVGESPAGGEPSRLPLHLVAAASASTGALAWVVSYPFDGAHRESNPDPPGARLAGRRLASGSRPLATPSSLTTPSSTPVLSDPPRRRNRSPHAIGRRSREERAAVAAGERARAQAGWQAHDRRRRRGRLARRRDRRLLPRRWRLDGARDARRKQPAPRL